MITVSNADAVLKDYYLQAVTAQLNDNISPFFSAIEKNTGNVYGKDVKLSIIRNDEEYTGVKACNETEDLPTPSANRYAEICVPLKNIYGTIEVSDKALRASRDSSGAFVNIVNAEMEGLISDAKQQFQRMLYCDGNGTYCRIIGKASGDNTDQKFTVDDASKLPHVNTAVDIYSQARNAFQSTTISAIDVEKNTVTFATSISINVTNAYIMAKNMMGKELTGLGAIFDTYGILYGNERDEDMYFEPYRVSVEEELTEEDVIGVLDHMEENFNSKINMILCSYSMRRKISKLMSDNKVIVNSNDVNGGYGAITVNGVPVYADKYCPDDIIYFVNTDDFVLCQLCDWEWLEDEDGKILKQVPGKAAYSATLVKYAELICKKPCGQAMIKIV